MKVEDRGRVRHEVLGDQCERAINDRGRDALTVQVNRNAPTCVLIITRVLQFQRVRGLTDRHVPVLFSGLSTLTIDVIVSQTASMVDRIYVLLQSFRCVS